MLCGPRVQAILAQRDNVCEAAALTAAGVKAAPAADVVERLAVQRAGKSAGRVTITGNHTGQADVDVAIRIAAGGATSRPGEPTFSGIGTGVMSAITAGGGVTPQTFTVALKARDPDALFASAKIAGIEVRARTAGVNTISIGATENLTLSAQPVATLLVPLSADQVETDNEALDFGAYALDGRGQYDPATLRLRFGKNPEVIRQHRERRDGKDYIVFSPPIPRGIPAGTAVYTVTGDYDVTVHVGASQTPYNGLTTLFDLFSALIGSADIEIVDPILPDSTPGGISATDIDILSAPTLVDEQVSDPAYMDPAEDVVVDAAAATDTITATVAEIAAPGFEVWQWRNRLGVLGTSLTGELFESAELDARLPAAEPIVNATATPPRILDENYAARREGSASVPEAYLVSDEQGVGWIYGPALNKPLTLTLTWRARPPEDADCETSPISGRLDAAAFGLDPADFPSGSAVSVPATTLVRLQTLSTWISGRKSNANAKAGTASNPTNDLQDDTSRAENLLYDHIFLRMRKLASDIAEQPATAQEAGPDKTGAEAWDDALTAIQALPVVTEAATDDAVANQLVTFSAGGIGSVIDSIVEHAYHEAGIDPKSSASIGDGCWRDYGDDSYFEVVTDDGRKLCALFPGRPWCSAEMKTIDGLRVCVDTQEAGLHLSWRCFDLLELGDSLKIRLDPGASTSAYRLGSQYKFTIVAGRPVRLRGGQTGGAGRTFAVVGSVDGALADYALDTAAPAAYSGGGIGFLITEGGVPFALQDAFAFVVDRAQYELSTDGGASYDPPADIVDGAVALFGGISAEFDRGPGVSFEAGDIHSFRVYQPYAPTHALYPAEGDVYRVDGALDYLIDFGIDQTVEIVGIVATKDVTVQLLDAADVALSPATVVDVATTEGAGHWNIDGSITARKLRITAADWTDEALTWAWAGVPVDVMGADQVTPRRERVMTGGGSANPQRTLAGYGYGVSLSWSLLPSVGVLERAELHELRALMAAVSGDHQNVLVLPNVVYPEAFFCRWASDTLADIDKWRYKRSDPDAQRLEAAIDFAPVLFSA